MAEIKQESRVPAVQQEQKKEERKAQEPIIVEQYKQQKLDTRSYLNDPSTLDGKLHWD